jgi:hypothetical protein
LAAAEEADRQLRLSDLLGTAYLLLNRAGGDDFRDVVLAQAETQCRQASPSAVVLNRWGARGWGGIALALAVVTGLSLVGPDDRRSEARAGSPGGGVRSWRDLDAADQRGNVTGSPSDRDYRRAKTGAGTDDADPLKSTISTPEPGGTARTTKGPNAEPGNASDGAGGGAGRTPVKDNTASPANPLVSGAEARNDGRGTAGGGGKSTTQANGAGSTGGSSPGDGGNVRRPAPVWQSNGWPADQQAARSAVERGAVPEAYRDLVREYFERR